MFRARRRKPLCFRRGDLVVVRSEQEIRATLDAEGKLEGLPLMPEMVQFFGRAFRVCCRAERVFLDRYNYVARMERAVFLEGVRCDGTSHGGCHMGCLLFWKEAWLRPAEADERGEKGDSPIFAARKSGQSPAAAERADRVQSRSAAVSAAPCRQNAGTTGCPTARFCCQATELVYATSRLPWWDARQYVRDLTSGDLTLGQFARMLPGLVFRKLRRWCGRGPGNAVVGRQEKTETASLRLQPGEWVEVKSRAEIEATLDALGRNRGLGFGGEMLAYCGRPFRVAHRVERLIVEWTGQMRQVSNTVALEGVTCQGRAMRGCPRDCYHLWREIWLRRVP